MGKASSSQHETLRRLPRYRRAAALLALGLSVGAGVLAGDRLREENDSLKRQVEIAGQDGFHAVLDLAAPRLRLLHGGAVLRDYELRRIELGEPSLAFISVRRSKEWRNRILKLEGLRPRRHYPRTEIVVPDPDSDPPPPIVPPEPAEAYPAPPRYLLALEDGISVEVVQESSEPLSVWGKLAAAMRWKLRDVSDILLRGKGPRLRLVMTAEEAGALYRSLPADMDMLVIY